jgi:hypothetical protein
MRVSNQSGRARGAAAALLAVMLTACAASVPSSAPQPTVAPTPVITPNPHLTDPATADAIFSAIRSAGLPLSTSNAFAGAPNAAVVKRINAAVDNWPLIITQYQDTATLRAAVKWDPSKPPAAGSPPYAFVGLNIMVAFGPPSGKPVPPDASRQAQALRLVGAMDPLLWPIQQRSVTPIPTSTPPAAVPAPSAAKPKASVKP